MLKIAVCDDEEYFRRRIKNIILQYMKELQYDCSVDCYESGEAILEASVRKMDYKVIFLDVSMRQMDGIETAKAIRKLAPDAYIIFVTAYINYALEGYKVDAIRYLLKEDSYLEIAMKECLDTVIDRLNYKEVKCTFKFQNGKIDLMVDRILYIESRLHKLIFYVMNESLVQYCMYDKLDTVEDVLNMFGFQRIHQSFLVNMKYVKSVERYKVHLLNGIELGISKRYYKDVESKYIKARSEL